MCRVGAKRSLISSQLRTNPILWQVDRWISKMSTMFNAQRRGNGQKFLILLLTVGGELMSLSSDKNSRWWTRFYRPKNGQHWAPSPKNFILANSSKNKKSTGIFLLSKFIQKDNQIYPLHFGTLQQPILSCLWTGPNPNSLALSCDCSLFLIQSICGRIRWVSTPFKVKLFSDTIYRNIEQKTILYSPQYAERQFSPNSFPEATLAHWLKKLL